MGQFEDDMQRSRLETLLLQVKPKSILVEKGGLSRESQEKIRKTLGDVEVQQLTPKAEFWGADTTMSNIWHMKYFQGKDQSMPNVLADMQDSTLALSALGAAIWHLQYVSLMLDVHFPLNFNSFFFFLTQLKIDAEVVPLGNFHKVFVSACFCFNLQLNGTLPLLSMILRDSPPHI